MKTGLGLGPGDGFRLTTLAMVAALAASIGAETGIAQAPASERVAFHSGTSFATLKGTLVGPDRSGHDYVVGAKAGQTLTVELSAKNPGVYFNVLPPGSETALVNTSITGEPRWSGTLPGDGDYKVRVYLMRASARHGAKADYTLEIYDLPSGGR